MAENSFNCYIGQFGYFEDELQRFVMHGSAAPHTRVHFDMYRQFMAGFGQRVIEPFGKSSV